MKHILNRILIFLYIFMTQNVVSSLKMIKQDDAENMGQIELFTLKTLPKELFHYIFSFCDPNTLSNTKTVSTTHRNIICQDFTYLQRYIVPKVWHDHSSCKYQDDDNKLINKSIGETGCLEMALQLFQKPDSIGIHKDVRTFYAQQYLNLLYNSFRNNSFQLNPNEFLQNLPKNSLLRICSNVTDTFNGLLYKKTVFEINSKNQITFIWINASIDKKSNIVPFLESIYNTLQTQKTKIIIGKPTDISTFFFHTNKETTQEIITFFLQQSKDQDFLIVDSGGNTLLHFACHQLDKKTYNLLSPYINPKIFNDAGDQCFHLPLFEELDSYEEESQESTEESQERGKKIQERASELSQFASYLINQEKIDCFNIKLENGSTPIMLALQEKMLQRYFIFYYLLQLFEKNSDKDLPYIDNTIKDSKKRTLIHYVCQWSETLTHTQLRKFFQGITPESCLPDYRDNSPLHYLCSYVNGKTELQIKELIKILLTNGKVDPNLKNFYQKTALDFAKNTSDMVVDALNAAVKEVSQELIKNFMSIKKLLN